VCTDFTGGSPLPSLKNSRKFALLALLALLLLMGGAPAPQAQKLEAAAGLLDLSNTELFPPPIPLGVSGGNANDTNIINNQEWCCSGTLGCLVIGGDSSGTLYILSNNHVLARTNKGVIGEGIIQPGLVDVNCDPSLATVVANLSRFVKIKFGGPINYVDAAIAQVVPDMVNPSGEINLIGAISSQVLANPPLDTAVQKSGSTSGLTTGTLLSVGVKLKVTYEKKCNAGSRVATFKKLQMYQPGNFIQSGDSGSLIVTDPAIGCPQPVGLAFAGSSSYGFACPIQTVLDTFKVTIVGTCIAAPDSAAGPAPTAPQAEMNMTQADEVARLTAIKERHDDAIFKIPEVVGTGVGLHRETKTPVVEIYLEKDTPEVRRQLPKTLNGAPVQIIETGKVRAL